MSSVNNSSVNIETAEAPIAQVKAAQANAAGSIAAQGSVSVRDDSTSIVETVAGSKLGNIGANSEIFIETVSDEIALGALNTNLATARAALDATADTTAAALDFGARVSDSLDLANENNKVLALGSIAAVQATASDAIVAADRAAQLNANLAATLNAASLAANADTTAAAIVAADASAARNAALAGSLAGQGIAGVLDAAAAGQETARAAMTAANAANSAALAAAQTVVDSLADAQTRNAGIALDAINAGKQTADAAGARSEAIVRDALGRLAEQREPEGQTVTRSIITLAAVAAAALVLPAIFGRRSAAAAA